MPSENKPRICTIFYCDRRRKSVCCSDCGFRRRGCYNSCKRCGGILTSEQGLRDGYGPCCLKKMREEEEYRQFMEKQYSLFDMAAEAEAAKTPAKEKFAVQPAADIFRDSEDSAEAAGKETNHESAQE